MHTYYKQLISAGIILGKNRRRKEKICPDKVKKVNLSDWQMSSASSATLSPQNQNVTPVRTSNGPSEWMSVFYCRLVCVFYKATLPLWPSKTLESIINQWWKYLSSGDAETVPGNIWDVIFLELFWCLCLKLKVDFMLFLLYEQILWCFSCFYQMFSRSGCSIFIFMNPKQRLPTFSSSERWFILSLWPRWAAGIQDSCAHRSV